MWTNALEFCNVILEGKNDPQEAMAAITSNLFHNMGFRYDTEKAASHYWYEGGFELTKYMAHLDERVNCFDQAYGVATLAGLVGIKVQVIEAIPFGYINTTNLVGVGLCNNPAYNMTDRIEYWKGEVDDQGDLVAKPMTNVVLQAQVCPVDETQRSCFESHAFAGVFDGRIFDACIGPVLGTTLINDYMRSLIDYSTENERKVSRYGDGVRIMDKKAGNNYTLK